MTAAPQPVPDLNGLLEQIRRQTEQVQRVQRSVEALEVRGQSRGREVTVTLRGDGRFTAVEIDQDAIHRYDARNLGDIVLEAVNSGLSALAEASRTKFAPLLDRPGEDL
ncbi:YbaB/EbfC family nucleoid-associated protein [Amycolatopsis nigrescens]|uniref:YbaB/EbfC family nucleoid-associated protein n=1 Tax=Amycolatopsis nigrescens TaxID=381445 RepID=UPI0003609155|nr:YbaB/EbfC family nucleoid-associated protein [Amycolatopsis nigrescens]